MVLDVRTEVGDRAIVDIDAGQDLTRLVLGLSTILGSADADRLWLLEGGVYRPLGPLNPRQPEPIGDHLEDGQMYTVVLSEHEPAVIRGGP